MWTGVAFSPFLNFRQLSFSTAIVGYSWIAVATALLLLLLQTGRLRLATTLLRNGALTFFGTISYTLYLFHSAILGLTFVLLFKTRPIIAQADHLFAVFAALTGSVCLATLTWQLFEKRLVQIGHRVAYEPAARYPVIPAQ
jgi:peptidoglycan/LPS O-acetylase OafA/YrhL